MGRHEFAQKISARSGVSVPDVEAVLQALADMARQHGLDEVARLGDDDGEASRNEDGELVFMDTTTDLGSPAIAWQQESAHAGVPSIREIETLIEDARRHPLGVDFLLNGDLGAVAITFRTHAFTVEAARRYLREHGAAAGPLV